VTALGFPGFGSARLVAGELLLGPNNLTAPWLAFTGFFVIALMMSLLVFVGEAVRDAFDPRAAGMPSPPCSRSATSR
jgi:microcin C transport system permease protein